MFKQLQTPEPITFQGLSVSFDRGTILIAEEGQKPQLPRLFGHEETKGVIEILVDNHTIRLFESGLKLPIAEINDNLTSLVQKYGIGSSLSITAD